MEIINVLIKNNEIISGNKIKDFEYSRSGTMIRLYLKNGFIKDIPLINIKEINFMKGAKNDI